MKLRWRIDVRNDRRSLIATQAIYRNKLTGRGREGGIHLDPPMISQTVACETSSFGM